MVFNPDKEWIENSNVYKFMIKRNLNRLEDFVRYTYENPEFWDQFVKLIGVEFKEPYAKVLDLSRGKQWPQWFIGGKLNIGDQLRDSSDVFIKWMDEDLNTRTVTYSQILNESKSIASWLKKIGLKKGDRVAIYMPMIPEIVSVMLGAIRVGTIIVPLFSGFGPEPIRVRVEDSEAKVIFTVDKSIRRGKEVDMLKNLEGLNDNITKVVLNRGGTKGDFYEYKDVIKTAGDYVEDTSTEDPMMIIYTSGTTGKPKGCVHTHDGFPIKASADIYFQFDLKNGETLMWVTDMGWMMGPWMVFGSLLLNAKMGMIEGYTSGEVLQKFVEDMKVDVLGVSASLVRALRSQGEVKLNVRLTGNTGEPIDSESWYWLFNASGKNPIINYSGGTEISGGILGNYVIKKIKPSSFNGPSPGINASVFNEEGKDAPPNVEGELVVLSVWPGMTRGFWRNPERYIETYWSVWKDVWVHGDLAYRDEEGYFYIVGRSDDTIKVAGKRVGPAEIESVLNSFPNVVESACIGIPDPMKGEKIVCFVVSKVSGIENQLIEYTEDKLGKAFAPSEIKIVKELPKTRNAKIMRRLIRAIYLNKPLGDISSLENPSALEEIKKAIS
ncbi:AMP-dependent synthetase [Saccharolobus solfataricus]|uniref:acetate--CoA ligase n=3 Tax=Saccharolobus solfataricus TaxID=2287 RepID=Q97WQ0_SACS2|nr:AMP-binding protein [Saccharolobus solfataricus]AAK42252.1 Acetyl-CoA synthetase (acetate-CoA ligase) (acsA-7) [Saccharolobus solfataricus P2]AKA74868.1 AMP-dependent synthetase [Saccharolobus solfataricus]AKA77564.1 AMP-dependent synthetase [Saccharolobus solfataricus]AKA80254.1 AMP-dependent synthetase [Saccharolobus solfataricus]AZF69334.1 AMP-dependent synthetase [Saccharolobus solfataricus]